MCPGGVLEKFETCVPSNCSSQDQNQPKKEKKIRHLVRRMGPNTCVRGLGFAVVPLLCVRAWLVIFVSLGFGLPAGPSTQYLRLLVPKTNPEWCLGPGFLNIGYLDPLGLGQLFIARISKIDSIIWSLEAAAPTALPLEELK